MSSIQARMHAELLFHAGAALRRTPEVARKAPDCARRCSATERSPRRWLLTPSTSTCTSYPRSAGREAPAGAWSVSAWAAQCAADWNQLVAWRLGAHAWGAPWLRLSWPWLCSAVSRLHTRIPHPHTHPPTPAPHLAGPARSAARTRASLCPQSAPSSPRAAPERPRSPPLCTC